MRAVVCLVLLIAIPASAWAQTPGPVLEYPNGPVVTSNRVIGLGGAFAGVAEGADGHLHNPASFATRYRFSGDLKVDWDWSFGYLSVPGDQNPDLYATGGDVTETNHVSGGIDIKVVGFGLGTHLHSQDYRLALENDEDIVVSNASIGVGLAYALHTLDIVLGSYIYLFSTFVTRDGPGSPEILSLRGAGSRVGLLWQPQSRPLRLGIALSTPFEASNITINDPNFFATPPSAVYLPSELVFGASYVFGERKRNPYMTYGLDVLERERPEPPNQKRRYIMFAYDFVVRASSPAGTQSMRSFLQGEDVPAGQRATVGIRAGVEAEVFSNWLVLRAGTYFEPTRTDIVPGRQHGTGGFAFRIPVGGIVPFWPWDLRGDMVVDIARDFRNIGFGAGFWH